MNLEAEKQKARDLIAKSEHIALLLAKHPTIDCLAAGEAAARVLSAQEKGVGFLPSVSFEAPPPPEAFSHILNPRPLAREFIIAVDTARSPVGQLRYEKHPERIEIILSPKSDPVREEALSFRQGKIQCDCLITFGVPDVESLSIAELGVEAQFFTETPIINIGNSDRHKPYGEINFLLTDGPPLSELTYELIKSVNSGPLDPETATVILTGITAQTQNFRSPIRISTHLAAADLLQAGADQARAAALAQWERPMGLLQLIARASVRSKESDAGRIMWSFLTAEDFEKTGRPVSDIPAVLEALPGFFPSRPVHVLLWQDAKTRGIKAMLQAAPAALAALAATYPGELRGRTLIPEAAFADFPQAEERLAALLREAL